MFRGSGWESNSLGSRREMVGMKRQASVPVDQLEADAAGALEELIAQVCCLPNSFVVCVFGGHWSCLMSATLPCQNERDIDRHQPPETAELAAHVPFEEVLPQPDVEEESACDHEAAFEKEMEYHQKNQQRLDEEEVEHYYEYYRKTFIKHADGSVLDFMEDMPSALIKDLSLVDDSETEEVPEEQWNATTEQWDLLGDADAGLQGFEETEDVPEEQWNATTKQWDLLGDADAGLQGFEETEGVSEEQWNATAKQWDLLGDADAGLQVTVDGPMPEDGFQPKTPPYTCAAPDPLDGLASSSSTAAPPGTTKLYDKDSWSMLGGVL